MEEKKLNQWADKVLGAVAIAVLEVTLEYAKDFFSRMGNAA
jgi:hypothetical protein